MNGHLDIAVIGAGPFGLSVAAHLQDRSVRTFGAEMATWKNCMPDGMLLRSAWDETSLSAPGALGTIDRWVSATGGPREEPIPLDLFLRYSAWFASEFVADRDPSDVAEITPSGSGFHLVTKAGAEVDADRLVIAVGVMPFAFVPPPLAQLFGEAIGLATGRLDDPGRHKGRRVLVVGGGQAGLESAGLAAQAGAFVELVTRSQVRWFADHEPDRPRGPLRRRLYRIAYPAVGYGPPPINRLGLYPDLFAALPAGLKRRLTERLLRPGGSPWLRPLVEGNVKLSERCTVTRVEKTSEGLVVELSDGSQREVDEVIIACGYRFDLDRLTFLAPEVRAGIAIRDGWPVLDRFFRTTDERVQFVGYPAEGRFGPVSRFVLGTEFTATRVAASLSNAGIDPTSGHAMKLLIRHPRSYPRERDYILNVVLTEFLGVGFNSIPEDRDDVELAIESGAGKTIRLPDIAFSVPDGNWPHSLILPTSPLAEARDPWIREVLGVDSVPILYGRPEAGCSYLEQSAGTVRLGIDVFGAAFVLLSRIEEVGESQRDAHGRFPSSASLATAHGFLDRPLVDEYVELLRSALERVFPGLASRRPEYAVDPSHDIDFVDGRKAGVKGQVRASARDLLGDRSPLLAARRAASIPLRPLLGPRVDVFNTFARLMADSEEIGVQSTFFFISGRAPGGLDDDNYEIGEPWVVSTIRAIVERGHRVGLHGSYLSSGSAQQLTEERVALERVIDSEAVSPSPLGCRQHFLRLDPRRTWPAQEAAGLAYDASSGYADRPGFRSGTCREHHLFHLIERRPLRLRERPLVLMDATLLDSNYLSLGVEPALQTAEHLARGCRRVGGTFTVLWHNTRLLTPAHRSLYREILAC